VTSLTVVPMDTFETARSGWNDLAVQSSNIFSTWEWAKTWWEHLSGRQKLNLAHARDQDGRTVAVLPLLTERRGAFRISRFVGHGVADQLGPVCHPRDAAAAARALNNASEQQDVLLAERLPASVDWRGLAGRVIREEESPVISLADGGWEGYLASRSSNFRQQVRRRGRRLAREFDVSYRLSDEPARLQSDLDTLFALHAARWNTASSAFACERMAFHRAFAEHAQELGWLRLWIAESGDQPVAAWYGFRFAGVESYYQMGRDPSWDRSSVGAGVLEHSIREAAGDGIGEYRLLRGDEAYKSRYATAGTTLITVAVAHGLRGKAIVGAAGALAGRAGGRRLLSSVSTQDA
jgi:CelD/BcsL family acetyltransferase involved in cellulose biosynthesis